MADSVIEHTSIAAPPDVVLSVLLDFETYPEWAKDLKAVEILQTDDEGRGQEVRFRAAAMGRSTSYTLTYDHSDPDRVAWKLLQGDVTRKLDGYYELKPAADGSDGTDVTYQLEAELVVPLPGFVKNRAQGRIMHAALAELKARAESLSA